MIGLNDVEVRCRTSNTWQKSPQSWPMSFPETALRLVLPNPGRSSQ